MSGNQQSETSNKLNTIQEAIDDIKAGKLVIVVDDEDRENEGDFLTAARNVTPEIINFMATHGRGLICTPLIEDRCKELKLGLISDGNTSLYDTPFTISVDLLGHGCTTGISASDRSKTVQALIDPNTKPEDLARPGHIFPLMAKKGGVLRRAGHTEATIDLARLAGFEPAGVLIEILNEDGTMARLPQLLKIAERFDLKIVSIADLIEYRMHEERLVERVEEVPMTTKYGTFNLIGYKQLTTGDEHLALVKGTWDKDEPVMVRVHSSNLSADFIESFREGGNENHHEALRMIEKEGKGIFLFMLQEGSNKGLLETLKSYKKQLEDLTEGSISTQMRSKMDNRDYGIGAQILRDLGVSKLKLISNNPKRRTGIIGYGLEIVDYVSVEVNSQEKESSSQA